MVKYPEVCPVCGKHKYEIINFSEICPVCGWEDDLLQFEDPNFKPGANKMSLNEAKAVYQKSCK